MGLATGHEQIGASVQGVTLYTAAPIDRSPTLPDQDHERPRVLMAQRPGMSKDQMATGCHSETNANKVQSQIPLQ